MDSFLEHVNETYVTHMKPFVDEITYDDMLMVFLLALFVSVIFFYWIEYGRTGKSIVKEVKEMMGMTKSHRKKISKGELLKGMTSEEKRAYFKR